MAHNRQTDGSGAPEVVNPPTQATFGFVSSDDYEYYERPEIHHRQASPVPESDGHNTEIYSPRISDASPRLSAVSPARSPAPGSDLGRSPPTSDGGFVKSRPLSSAVEYSEIHSPDPQAVYQDEGEKEAVQPRYSAAPAYSYAAPVQGIHHTNSGEKPQVWSGHPQDQHQYGQAPVHHEEQRAKRPFYKRWWFVVVLLLIVAIAIAVPVGVVVGGKKNKSSSDDNSGSGSSNTTAPGDTGNPNVTVGGALNTQYYSKAGAFNGSGIAIAAANTLYNQALYAYYQDYEGVLQYALYNPSGQWNTIGPINTGSFQALNGTPISAVQNVIGDVIYWHVFFVDEKYYLRERIITNSTTNGPVPVWEDGPLSSQNIQTWESDTIGMQACYYGNYYGQWTYGNQVQSGIHLFFAHDEHTFKQYNWQNGTNNTWTYSKDWSGVSGNGGVGCYTWAGPTEYVWFVNQNGTLDMSWRDNNKSVTATSSHPVDQWTPVDIGINNVQVDSSLGFTNYLVYQDQSAAIMGKNIIWDAEKTVVNGSDVFTLTNGNTQQPVAAVLGTHLSVTAVSTTAGIAQLQVFFQSEGNDVVQYNRANYVPDSLFSPSGSMPVLPPS